MIIYLKKLRFPLIKVIICDTHLSIIKTDDTVCEEFTSNKMSHISMGPGSGKLHYVPGLQT